LKSKVSETTQLELIDIQKMQFGDKAAAERAMLSFLRDHEDASIEKVVLNPKPESLNSISGFVTYEGGECYFFKTHVEESEQVSEYYNAESLARAGYPVVVAKQITHRVGKQIVLYEIVSFPTLFDLVKSSEDEILRGATAGQSWQHLAQMQVALDKRVFEIYCRTRQKITQEQHASAPIHQLFSHRLQEAGRIGMFYSGQSLMLDEGLELPFAELRRMRWRINGVEYEKTIAELVEKARVALKPASGSAIIGHGDAHNGNVFVDAKKNQLLLFDPAFAGAHDPLLDLTKPLFHNVFARWMYHPEQVTGEINLSCAIKDGLISVEHTFCPTELRLHFLRSKIEHVLRPLLKELSAHKQLRTNWQDYLRAALFCCPFLTVNLLAPFVANGTLAQRYPIAIKILGLCMAIELGCAERTGRNSISDIVDEIFQDDAGAYSI
jgi:hypothetical protein